MYEYRHGGNVFFEPGGSSFLDLSASVNPLGFPKSIGKTIEKEIAFCARYPDHRSTSLRKSISRFEGIDTEWIFCGNGSSDIIFRLPRCLKPRKAITLMPTFSDYERALKSFGADVNRFPLREERGFECDEGILDAIENDDPDMIVLCNPNNPTGILTSRRIIEKILLASKKTKAFVVIDECFIDFTERVQENTAKPFLADFDNLVIIKALTKTFALPGIRLGYALCGNEKIIDALYDHGPDWPVSNLAQAAGSAALDDAESYLERTVAFVKNERLYLKRELETMGFTVFNGQANYLFIKNPCRFDLKKRLDEHRIRIRSFDDESIPGSGFYRLAVSSKENNKRLIETIRGMMLEQRRER